MDKNDWKNPVFIISGIIIMMLVILGALMPDQFGKVSSMLFSAGFGSGLVFWGVAEPMSHFFSTPFAGIEPQSTTAARVAMGYSFFHWGISQWSVFAIVGLVIGFLQFRKKKDGLVSTALEPVAGKKPVVKHTIDSLAVISTVMGIATSVGLGVMQMNGGLTAVFRLGNSLAYSL